MDLPGHIDLSWYVDFENIEKACRSGNSKLQSSILTQKEFLERMYIKERFEEMKKCNDENTHKLLDMQLERLTGETYMGKIYKFYFFGDELAFPFDQEINRKA